MIFTFELVKDVALDGVKSELARHDRGDEKKIIFTNLGFANLPNQIYRKSVKDGFEFNLMVCGSSGLGKSTLMNSLFLTDIYSAVSTYSKKSNNINRIPTVKLKIPEKAFLKSDSRISVTFKL